MEFPAVHWRMPAHGAVKVNVHRFFTDDPLENSNRSGIGVVIRNHRGKLLRSVVVLWALRKEGQTNFMLCYRVL